MRGTHSIKDTLTAATGAVVPFHHSLVDQGGVTKLVLGYAHCGMVAGARWIAKCTIPCLRSALSQNPDYKIKVLQISSFYHFPNYVLNFLFSKMIMICTSTNDICKER